MSLDGPEIGEQPQLLAQSKQSLFGTHRGGIGVEPGISRCPDQYGIRFPAGSEDKIGQRVP